MIIGLVNQKGGAGKTTTAVHLAYWLSKRKSVVVVDVDRQKSSSNWVKFLNIDYRILSDPDELFDLLPPLAEEYGAVIVDAPGNLREIVSVLLDRCDLALVPCKQSGLDLHSTAETLKLIKQRQEIRQNKPLAALFLNQAKKGTVLLRESVQILQESGFPVLESVVYDRQCVMDAPGQQVTVWHLKGDSAKRSASEFEQLFKEVMEVLDNYEKS
jgi:chromosome partitioning protein